MEQDKTITIITADIGGNNVRLQCSALSQSTQSIQNQTKILKYKTKEYKKVDQKTGDVIKIDGFSDILQQFVDDIDLKKGSF